MGKTGVQQRGRFTLPCGCFSSRGAHNPSDACVPGGMEEEKLRQQLGLSPAEFATLLAPRPGDEPARQAIATALRVRFQLDSHQPLGRALWQRAIISVADAVLLDQLVD
jgi:hypothetical protein